MHKTIVCSFFNNKGGVGKTSCSLNVTAALAAKGKSVLFIDMCDSMNGTFHLRNNQSVEKAFPISSLLIDPRTDILDCILWDTRIQNVGLIASEHKITQNINAKLMGNEDNHTDMAKRLKKSLELLDGDFDYIIIDVSPSLDNVVQLALMVVTHLIFVSDSNAYSEQGIVNLLRSDAMKLVKKVNPEQTILGMLYNKIDMRKTLARELVNRKILPCGIPVLPMYIPERNEMDVNSFRQEFTVGNNKKSIISDSFNELADYLIEHMTLGEAIEPMSVSQAE